MKTPPRLSRLIGWFGRCATGMAALAFCASAVAGDSGGKNVVIAPTQTHPMRPALKKHFYKFTSASAIPQPIDRVTAPIPTTAVPITVYGNHFGN
jgi:hypothetical protein